MKTKEELKELKKEIESLNNKLKELTEDELNEVTAGSRGIASIKIPGLEGIMPYIVGGIPLDSDSKLKG